MRFRILIICFGIIFLSNQKLKAQSLLYKCENGEVSFISDANLELIEASSHGLKGILDPETNRFAFSIDIISFTGFNSALQLEHFRENYMEISRYGTATFEGRLIEQVNLLETGTHQLRAKGKMTIHGISQEIFLTCRMISDSAFLNVNTEFIIRLSDYNISIPKVVSRKVAEEIIVSVNAVLKTKD